MKKKPVRLKYYLLIFGCILILSCQDNTRQDFQSSTNKYSSLFTSIPAVETGIEFMNEIPENSAMNSMVYEYFYNGGGVAVGDIDNDGLPDIYFTANLKDNKLYKNKGNFQFEDITNKAAVEGTFGWTTGVTMVDLNADGWLDIYICKSGKGKEENRENQLFQNNKDGTFKEMAEAYGLNFTGYSTQASFFDYDKDGDLDMFLLNHNVTPINTNNPEKFKNEISEMAGDRFYRNDNGKFTDISIKAGILQNSLGFGLGVSIGDLNEDGWPDIYVSNDYVEHDYLYYNNGDGTFSEAMKSSIGHTPNFSMGNDIADFNNDGLLDIISLDMVAEDNYGIKTSMSGMNPEIFNYAVENGFHYQYMFNALQLNNGNQNFSDVAQLAGVSNTDWSWAPLFADFDNDGLKDLFITNGLKRDFRNNDFRKYKIQRLEEAQKNSEKMSTVIEELIKKTPQRKTVNFLFKNNGDLTFEKVSKDWGLQKSTLSNGAAYADLDNDGDLDLIVNNIDEEATILKNNSNKKYIQFTFKGSSKNPFGIGTRVEILTKNGIQVVENYPTRGYQSSVEPILHFGVYDMETIDQVTVIWSDNKKQTLKNIPVNQEILLDYDNAGTTTQPSKQQKSKIFKDVTNTYGIQHKHIENKYNDYAKESLLPHKMSQFGPAIAVADINNDGLDDYFVGGAKGLMATLYEQNSRGQFILTNNQPWRKDKKYEDIDAVFFDVDNDNDLDLYVVSGGNEWPEGHTNYEDRLYINTAGKFSLAQNKLPKNYTSGSSVKPFDFDGDGDMDLFVGSRLFPQKYPFSQPSRILENNNGRFKDVTLEIAPGLTNAGMVTDALWTDFDNDGQTDLIIVGEWSEIKFYKNSQGKFKQDTSILPETLGWWNSIESIDVENDGDNDYVVGNLGLNYKYKASIKEPFEVYSTDFDDNGTNDIVLGYYNQGNLFPLRGRECTSNQMPFIKEKFPTYNSFGSANLTDVYTKEKLDQALHLKANMFSSVLLENLGGGKFKIHILPNQAQLSSINAIKIDDFDKDGYKDILVAGNLFQSEVETPRNDASIGLLLKGNGSSQFVPLPFNVSGVFLDGDVKKMRTIQLGNAIPTKAILVVRNNNTIKLISPTK